MDNGLRQPVGVVLEQTLVGLAGRDHSGIGTLAVLLGSSGSERFPS
jgi:hypothetical protein